MNMFMQASTRCCSLIRHILPLMELVISETPLCGPTTIYMELHKATSKFVFSHVVSLVSSCLDCTPFHNVQWVIFMPDFAKWMSVLLITIADVLTNMMEHPYFSVGTSCDIWTNSSLALAVFRIDHHVHWILVPQITTFGVSWKTWCINTRWMQGMNYFSEFQMPNDMLIALWFFITLHIP